MSRQRNRSTPSEDVRGSCVELRVLDALSYQLGSIRYVRILNCGVEIFDHGLRHSKRDAIPLLVATTVFARLLLTRRHRHHPTRRATCSSTAGGASSGSLLRSQRTTAEHHSDRSHRELGLSSNPSSCARRHRSHSGASGSDQPAGCGPVRDPRRNRQQHLRHSS